MKGSARDFFENKRWANAKYCPHCGSFSVSECKDAKPMPYCCKDCRKHFSVRTGTTLEKSRLPLQKWLMAIYIEFLGVWEKLNNPSFNSPEFEGIKTQAGLNRFSMSAKSWMDKVNGIRVIAKAGGYGGTFTHKGIALEFGSWLSPEFKLYLIKEFQRFKESESRSENLEWNVRRTLVKAQYRTHTDAVKAHLIPPSYLNTKKAGYMLVRLIF